MSGERGKNASGQGYWVRVVGGKEPEPIFIKKEVRLSEKTSYQVYFDLRESDYLAQLSSGLQAIGMPSIENGVWRRYDRNGRKRAEGRFRSGARSGLWRFWYASERRETKVMFKDGRKHGRWEHWYDDGKIAESGYFSSDFPDNLWRMWWGNGKQKEEKTFASGMLHGRYVRWHENGQKAEEGGYENGARAGTWYRWDREGRKIQEDLYIMSPKTIALAFDVAFNEHLHYYRKGTTIPYIVHPMDVASILMKNGAPEHVVAAGLLHDTVEDTEMTVEDVGKLFGDRVAELVRSVTEPEKLSKGMDAVEKKKTWKGRKQHTISSITAADRETKMLSCADKLANISDMIREHALMGEKLWSKFNATKEEQKWYYNSMLKALAAGAGSVADLPMYKELKRCVEQLFGSTE